MELGIGNAAFIGLATIGAVNAAIIFRPNLDSRQKFLIALVSAFILTFVPADIGQIIYLKAKFAIEVALASCGGYKVTQIIGSGLFTKQS